MTINRQEILDRAVNAIRQQGCPSGAPNTTRHHFQCKYRHEQDDGFIVACAIGHLIAPNVYTSELENKSVHSALVGDALIHSGIALDARHTPQRMSDDDFLDRVQDCHDGAAARAEPGDNAHFMRLFEHNVQDLAVRDRLVYTPPVVPDPTLAPVPKGWDSV